MPDKVQGQQTLYIDPVSTELLDDIGWQRYSALAKLVEWWSGGVGRRDAVTHLGRHYGYQWLHLLLSVLGFALLRFIQHRFGSDQVK